MDIFIGNLPANGRLVELEELLGGLSARSRFERRIGSDGFERNYHFFVISTETDADGLALIARINGMLFEGNRLTARQYVQRAKSTVPAADWDGIERRINPAVSE